MSPRIKFFLFIALFSLTSAAAAEVTEIFPGDSFKAAFESLGPGDTLIVHQGTYSESGSRIRISAKGTEALPIIVKGADGEARPLITRPAGSTPQNTINIEGATYVTIQHLEISGNGDGINMTGGPHHITIEDNEIHDIDVGVNFRSSMDSIVVRRNHIYNTNGTAEGMYVGCNRAACAVSNSIIEQNWIHDTRGSQGDGIEIKYGSWGNIIRDNVIHDANFPCILAYGVTNANIDRPNIIEGNVVWNCGQDIDVIADAIVRNNIVFGTLETQSHVQVPVMRNVTIVNNTVIGSMPLRGWGGGDIPSSLTVANNVIYGGSITNQPSGANVSSNLQYSSGAPDIFVDPDNWDFWPTPGSPLIGAANPTYAPANDFNGTSRQAPFDVGAYESDGLASNPGWPIGAGFKDSSPATRFTDVPTSHWAYAFIEALAVSGITGGCGGNNYCPDDNVSRAQLAVFLERGMRGSNFVPDPASGNVFLDVGASDFAAAFIEQLFVDGITGGCGGNNYCPNDNVTRAQMAVFLLRAKYGAGYAPPPATGVFSDVPLGSFAVNWIEALATEGISGGCGNGNFCPDDAVTRAQMAVFLVKTFDL